MNYIAHLSHRARGVFYGWWLVGISSFIRTSSVPLFHAMGLWFVALEAQFGWNRTQLSLAFAFTRVESGLLGPAEGYLTDRVGTRRLVFIGLLIMGAGFLLFGQVNHLWVFYVAFLIMALGQGLSGWLPITTMLNNWFVRRRSSAMGWSNSGSRLGGLLLNRRKHEHAHVFWYTLTRVTPNNLKHHGNSCVHGHHPPCGLERESLVS